MAKRKAIKTEYNEDVDSTVQLIFTMCQKLRQYSDEMERLALRMRKTRDLSYAAEAIGILTSIVVNLRFDLLVVRPIRSLRGKD